MQSFLEEKPTGFLVVGIGASAGGVQALKEFFQQVSPDSGAAYVVILHLSPDHDSHLAQVLQTVSVIGVTQVTEKVKIEPDHIYVVPPNQHLLMEDGSILPIININYEERRAPVDIFFRALADTHGPRAVCVVLSGTGAHGSMGLKRIKEMGGVAYVQNPKEAEFNEMPRNAIATELVDEVLPVAAIPGSILAYRNRLGSIEITVDPILRPNDQQQALRAIFHQLRLRTGHDFSNYKQPTVLRRIERRINIRNLPNLPAYLEYMQNDPDETASLLKDLLISVTNFFRDQKAFQFIEQDVLPLIFQGKGIEDQVRIWVAGCATGEEAYSLAMLCAERTQGVMEAPKVQIFATDIDESAIAVGREGFFTLNDAADISPERLRRFFNKEVDGYRVRREIREMILFANHNFLKDPPFSRIDMITCRNVLIYLNHVAQERVMETFHFSLKSSGFLFLGSSESVDGASDLYSTFSREYHVFRGRDAMSKTFPLPETNPHFRFTTNQPGGKNDKKELRPPVEVTFGGLHQKLLEEYAPPSVVVNQEYEIVHMSKRVGRYFEFSGGEPTRNLLKLVRPEFRLELRSALYQAMQQKTAVEARDLKWSENSHATFVNLLVRPVLEDDDTAKGFILVLFEEKEDRNGQESVVVSTSEPVTQQMEEELQGLKVQLRKSNEQHDYQAEELRASNEELQAMNEELRSAAEEMETSKEELQSINEELRTVNQELKIKIDETSITSNNLQNLINSTDIGTIFLDRGLHVVLFTPAIREIFNLIPSDYSRLITDITHKLDYNDLAHDAETVLEKLTIVEREVTSSTGRTFTMRLLPYRTDDDRIGGVVVTFFDITRRREAEKALHLSEERLRLLIESAGDFAIFSLDPRRIVVSWNKGAENIFQFTPDQIMGRSGDVVFTYEDREEGAPEKEAETANKNGHAENERWHIRKDGTRFWGSGSTSPLRDESGKLLGYVKIMRDLTERKEAEEALRQSEERKEFLLKLNDTIRQLNDPVEIQYEAARLVAEQLNADRVHFAEINEDEQLVIRKDYVRGNAPSIAVKYRPEDIAAALKLSRDEPVAIHDTQTFPLLTEEEKAAFAAARIRSQLSVALNKIGKKVASFAVDQTTPREWTTHEASILAEAAERTWAAVERARIEEVNAADIQDTLLLRELSIKLIGEGNVQVLYDEIIGTAVKLLRADAGTIQLYNEETQQVILLSAVGMTDSMTSRLNRLNATPGTSYAHAFQTRKRVLLTFDDPTLSDPDGTNKEHLEAGLLSAQTTPLIARSGKLIGLISTHWKQHHRPKERELRFLDLLVRQAADLIHQRHAEEAMRQSEARFRTVTDAVPHIIWSNDAEGNANYFNQRWYAYSGRTYKESVGLGWQTIVHPDDSLGSVKKWHEALHKGNIFDTEFRLRNAKDEYRWHLGRNLPLKDEQGNVIGWFGSATDIEDLKKAEEAVRNTSDRLQLALEAGKLGTYEYDFATGEYYTTAQHKANFGYAESEQVTFESLKERIVPEDQIYMETTFHKALDKNAVYATEYRTLLPNGDIRWIRSVGRFVYNEQKLPQKMVGITLDITEQKLFTEELSRLVAERTKELERSNADLQQFAHVASHDLKEPVRKIKTFNNRIIDDFSNILPEKVRTYLSKIGSASDRMIQMVEGILKYSKFGNTNASLKRIDLSEIIRQIEMDLEVLIEQKSARIETSSLPQLTGDSVLLHQLFYNLVLNSLKFAKPDQAPVIKLDCETVEQDNKQFYEITVADNGIGFEQEHAEAIFGTFTRLNATDEYEGTGLGLALCKKIVERHRGFISANGKLGNGATFSILLPVEQ